MSDASESPGKPTILIVEDNPQSLAALEAILERPDRQFLKAGSGEEALKFLLDHDAAVILLDVRMADSDGYQTASLIRKRKKTQDIPIIFLTAFNKDNTDVMRGYSLGGVDYIFKPVVPEILRAKVDVFVELYKKNQALQRKNEQLERTERELLRTTAMATLVKYAPDPVFVSDLDANILHANEAAARLLGLNVEELKEQSLARFLSSDEAQQFTKALHEVVQHGITKNVSLHPCSTAGVVTPTTLNASALLDERGKIVGAIGIFRDMTAYERVVKELEHLTHTLEQRVKERTQVLEETNRRLEELNKLKSSFVSIASHEIRTPVTGIKAYTENLLSGIAGPISEKQQKYLTRVLSNVNRLMRIIQELLDLAKIEAGQLELQVSTTAMEGLIQNVLEEFKPMAVEKNIRLEACGSALGKVINADEGKLHQVLNNLVHNAVKFTAPGGRVTVQAETIRDGAIQVCVSDTGPGMNAEETARVFDKFYCGQSVPPESRGAGLGLAISKGLIALHGGSMWVASVPGEGSRFYFEIPHSKYSQMSFQEDAERSSSA